MVKTKYRNQLQPEDDLRCALTTITPDFDKLVIQVQGSHRFTVRVCPINKQNLVASQ